ncbi:spore-associated protein A [Streptomyces albidoflavus]
MPRSSARLRTPAGLAAALVLAAAGVAVTAPPASAAAYNGVCGKGYTVALSLRIGPKSGSAVGTVYLAYNAATGHKCAVTVKNDTVPRKTSVFLRVGGKTAKDSGTFTSYAGPVRVRAAGQCVDFGGSIGNDDNSATKVYCK